MELGKTFQPFPCYRFHHIWLWPHCCNISKENLGQGPSKHKLLWRCQRMGATPTFFARFLEQQLHQNCALFRPHIQQSSSHAPHTIGLQASCYFIPITYVQYIRPMCGIHLRSYRVHHMINKNVHNILLQVCATMLWKINKTKVKG